MPRDFTDDPGNPSYELKRMYPELMATAASNPELGLARFIGVLKDWVGRGITLGNAAFWLKKAEEMKTSGTWGGFRGRTFKGGQADPNAPGAEKWKPVTPDNPDPKYVAAVQKIISDFVMAAMGLSPGTGGNPRRRFEDCQINTMANLMNEDGQYRVSLTADMVSIIETANRYGFVVEIAEPAA